jgi:hypothetical protein
MKGMPMSEQNKRTHLHPENMTQDVNTDAVNTGTDGNNQDEQHKQDEQQQETPTQPAEAATTRDTSDNFEEEPNIIEKANQGTANALGDITQGLADKVDAVEEKLQEAEQERREHHEESN